MNDQDLFSGYDAYTTTTELGLVDDDSVEAGFSPSSGPCLPNGAEAIRRTIVHQC